jgi:hypothetical protein
MRPVDFDGKPATTGTKVAYPPLLLIRNNDQVGVIRTLDNESRLTSLLYTQHALRFIDRNARRPAARRAPRTPSTVSVFCRCSKVPPPRIAGASSFIAMAASFGP